MQTLTLMQRCKQRFPSIKAFAVAAGVPLSHASNILHGRRQPTTIAEMVQMESLLGLADHREWSLAMRATWDDMTQRRKAREAARGPSESDDMLGWTTGRRGRSR